MLAFDINHSSSSTGNHYAFQRCTPIGAWTDLGGVYIFTRENLRERNPLYVGKTESFRDRMTQSHHAWTSAQQLGMNVIYAVCISSSWERDELEKELIRTLCPLLNTQHRLTPSGFLQGGLLSLMR